MSDQKQKKILTLKQKKDNITPTNLTDKALTPKVRQNFGYGKSKAVEIEIKGQNKFGLKNDLKKQTEDEALKKDLMHAFPNLTKKEIEIRMNALKNLSEKQRQKEIEEQNRARELEEQKLNEEKSLHTLHKSVDEPILDNNSSSQPTVKTKVSNKVDNVAPRGDVVSKPKYSKDSKKDFVDSKFGEKFEQPPKKKKGSKFVSSVKNEVLNPFENDDFDDVDILSELEKDESVAAINKPARQTVKVKDKKPQKEKKKSDAVKKDIVLSPNGIILSDLAHRLSIDIEEIEKILTDLDVKVTNKKLSKDAAELIVQHFGYNPVLDTIDGILYDNKEKNSNRPPVVVVMGHVDHGKTSLLDAMRKSNVVKGEKGGITQHIGAYSISTESGDKITFLDTPGHALFKDMRARGVVCTDIVVLVVAADDGVKEQTVEAITHAQSVNLPIIVAINKMDREGADVDRVRRELSNYNVLVESYGGDVIEVQVSAKNGQGMVDLQKAILLQSQMLDLRTYVDGRANGFIIESRIDKGRGAVATVLVKDGTLHQKDIVVCGTITGKVRTLNDHNNKQLKSAGPSSAVVVSGFSEMPVVGDSINVVRDDKDAKTIVESRINERKIEESRVDPFSMLHKNTNHKEFSFVVKADVAGSLDALKFGLESLSTDEVKILVIRSEVGDISESDLSTAHLSNGTVVGFNVKSNLSKINKEYEKVPVKYYNIIYDLMDDVTQLIKDNTEEKFNEIFLGSAEVIKTFDMKDDSGKFRVAGCIVKEGEMNKSQKIKVIRGEKVILAMGDMRSLEVRRIETETVPKKEECGIVIKKFTGVEVGDIIECFEVEKI
jgi:translation initiation factor IF-2